jgi:hypothetical protein
MSDMPQRNVGSLILVGGDCRNSQSIQNLILEVRGSLLLLLANCCGGTSDSSSSPLVPVV